MAHHTIDECLQTLKFSAPLRGEFQDQLARIAHLEDFSESALIFREGAENQNLYLIVSGHVALEMHVSGRGQVRILSLGPGDVLAWSALISNQRMTASAIALEPAQLITFPSEPLRELCEANPELGYHVMLQMSIALSKRLLATRLQLLDLFAETAPNVFRPGI